VVEERDHWLEQYMRVVPEKLRAADARVLLDLLTEDHERLAEALVALSESDVDPCA
jgi:hypothetical protein